MPPQNHYELLHVDPWGLSVFDAYNWENESMFKFILVIIPLDVYNIGDFIEKQNIER